VAHVIVVGAGPAGASLAWLLADRGIEVTLVERQSDFAREFRGEVLLSTGIEALEQLGLGEVFESTPRVRPDALEGYLNRRQVIRAALDPDYFEGRVPTPLSQPALLEGIVGLAEKRPCFRLLRGASVRDLLVEAGRVAGVRTTRAGGAEEIRADLVVGADGRASVVRRRGGFRATHQDLPMDIVWCKVGPLDALRGARAYIGRGHLLIAYRSHDERTQVAWAILKGTFGELRARGIEQWVEEMAAHTSPDLSAHLLASRDEIQHPFLLDCQADRVTRWSRPGALLVGDAAHVMSPVGGQGLNIALRDVIVAANQLVPVLQGDATAEQIDAAAARVERERVPEVQAIQRLQALPPRVVLSRSWWSEPVRHLLTGLLRTGFGQRRLLEATRIFQFGRTDVELRV